MTTTLDDDARALDGDALDAWRGFTSDDLARARERGAGAPET
jgi:hypothetical protein